jgi:hypothetical protein
MEFSMLNETIRNFMDKNREIHNLQQKLDADMDKYKEGVLRILKKKFSKFRGIDYYFSFDHYEDHSENSDWIPGVKISRIASGNQGCFIKTENGWIFYKDVYPGRYIFRHKIGNKALPFDPQKLESICEELNQALQMPVDIAIYKFFTKSEEYLNNEDEVLATHPGATILTKGEKKHVGWDISDPWIVIQDIDGKHIYYSTNGHGFGFDQHLLPGQDTSKFIDFIGERLSIL